MKDFRNILKSVLEDKKNANPNYSLRAFARFLGMSPPRLSMILNGKRGISEDVAIQIAKKISLTPIESQYFIASAVAEASRSPQKRLDAKNQINHLETQGKFHILEEDAFKIISNWQHYALLELILTKDFKSDVNWIAKRLNTSPFEIQQCLNRLAENGMIKIKNGQIKSTFQSFTTTNDIPSKSVRQLSHDLLNKAINSLETQSVEERDVSTLTVGISKDRLPEFKKMLRDFRRNLNQFAESIPVEERDQVYVYACGFYQLTQDIEDI